MSNFQNNLEEYTNVLVIGCGGAGLRAAIEVKINNLSVKVLGKRKKNDAHTVLAAGGINASFGNLDPQDSWMQHFADTYLEGYQLGDPSIIEIMVKNACAAVEEIDQWGGDFEKLQNGKLNQRYFGAHTYRRTCFKGDYTGFAILDTLLKKAEKLKIPIYDTEYVSDLLIKEERCYGAMSINTKTGERTVHLADAVILCTGGHTKIWKKSSSRNGENTGDGFHLGLKAGCELIDMEMVQFHPTGMVFPKDMEGTLVTEAVRGEGGKLFNSNGKRFMVNYDKERMELSTRDRVAIANYKEIIEGRTSPNGGIFLDISHKSKDFIISKIPKIYNQFLESQNIDISKYPMEVAPTAHYSMGGISVNPEDHATCINGLYAAGEVAGGLHGANRLGGNSLSEILVFGKLAGHYACEYSRKVSSKFKPKNQIKLAHQNIDMLIKKGNEETFDTREKLSDLMWKYCGVMKDEENLKLGLDKLEILKEISKNINVKIDENNPISLIELLDLNSSIISAELTIKSSIMRKESRGAHNRSDYPILNNEYRFNILATLKEEELILSKKKLKPLKNELRETIINTNKIENLSQRLLE